MSVVFFPFGRAGLGNPHLNYAETVDGTSLVRICRAERPVVAGRPRGSLPKTHLEEAFASCALPCSTPRSPIATGTTLKP